MESSRGGVVLLRSGHTAQKNLTDNGKGERLNAKELVAVDGDRQLRETLVTSIHATIVLLVAYEGLGFRV